ncbi:MAG: hypothetical protein ACTHNT_03075 [Actinomycetales bacterium]
MSALMPLAVDPDKVITGPLGMLMFLLLCAATFLLLRSFLKQLKKLDKANLPHDDKPRGVRRAGWAPVADEPSVDGRARRSTATQAPPQQQQ